MCEHLRLKNLAFNLLQLKVVKRNEALNMFHDYKFFYTEH